MEFFELQAIIVEVLIVVDLLLYFQTFHTDSVFFHLHNFIRPYFRILLLSAVLTFSCLKDKIL